MLDLAPVHGNAQTGSHSAILAKTFVHNRITRRSGNPICKTGGEARTTLFVVDGGCSHKPKPTSRLGYRRADPKRFTFQTVGAIQSKLAFNNEQRVYS